MAYDRFLIAPLKTGLDKYGSSWIQNNDAFEELQNAYVFRDSVRKRFGTTLSGSNQLLSRLRIQIGTTDANGDLTPAVNLPGVAGQIKLGQIFSVGNVIFTVDVLGTAQLTKTTFGAITATIDSNAVPNSFAIVGDNLTNLNTPVYYYPANPVMGIDQYFNTGINNNPTYAFDTQFSYIYTATGWNRVTTTIWNGSDSDFFWVANWIGMVGGASQRLLFVTNFTTADPMYSFDGTTFADLSAVTTFLVAAGNIVKTARIIIPFSGRLLLLNTIEGAANTVHVNRCRFSASGDPLTPASWLEVEQAGYVGGGLTDAPTSETIVSAEFIKNRLIVYFERSTWELVSTGNSALPFLWQQLNSELGADSTFSIISTDKYAVAKGQSGFHACNGSNVDRIDEKIPNKVFEFNVTGNNAKRTAGIRDYYAEMFYWAYTSNSLQATQTFPNKVLTYNYTERAWAENDDCFTAFGYVEQTSALTWADYTYTTWQQWIQPWNSPTGQPNQRKIAAGNQQGFMLFIDTELPRNAPSQYIANIAFPGTCVIELTIYNHNYDTSPNLQAYDSDFILIENVVGDADLMNALNGKIFEVNKLEAAANANVIQIDSSLSAGTYDGGGTAARVSNVLIKTKNFNPYVDKGRSVYVAKIDFAVQKTEFGQISVDYNVSTAELSMVDQAQATSSNLGNSILETSPYDVSIYPWEKLQRILWHPIYFQASGEFIQINMHFSLQQMLNPLISLSPFKMEAMCLYTQATSDRMQ